MRAPPPNCGAKARAEQDSQEKAPSKEALHGGYDTEGCEIVRFSVGVVNPDFPRLVAVGRHSEVELTGFWRKAGVAGTFASWNWLKGVVGVSVALRDFVEFGIH
jgi:hypothetical protein